MLKELTLEEKLEITAKALEKNNMQAFVVDTCEQAVEKAAELLTEGETISCGGSVSLLESGVLDLMKSGKYNFLDRSKCRTNDEKEEIYRKSFFADTYLTCANAVTMNGELYNVDGNSNRVSAIAQGPKKVVFVVGMNKVCPDVDSALKRARNVAAPINAQRFDLATPCCKTGKCMDCKSPDTICCQFLITRFSRHKDRIHVILVGEDLGF
jgi:hypothetical protein